MSGAGAWRLVSRLAALALLLLAVVVLVVGLGLPYLEWRAGVAADVAREAALVARYRALAASAAGPAGDAAGAARPAEPGLEGVLLPAASEGQAMAALQDRLKALSAAAGLTLVSVQAMAREPGAAGGEGDANAALQRLTIRLKLAGDTAQLNRFLYEVESGQPWLLVDNLFINARSGRAIGPGAGLDVQLDVSGLQAKGGS